MHELSLCEDLLRMVQAQAEARGCRRVRAVWLEIGALEAVESEALRFGFELKSRGTVAEGARLEIRQLPGRARCPDCGASVALYRRHDPCPRCGSLCPEVSGGDGIRIERLEVD